jgi:hypothetical protein
MANSINEGSYAQYEDFDNYAYNCVKHLMDNDEVVWKLLKYKTPDAWNQPNLTRAEKAALIYAGQDDASKFNVFLDQGQPDAETSEGCIIRISPHSVFPDNRVYGTVSMILETYSNYHINTLSNYKTRVDMITKRLIQVFNGSSVGGLGKLFFDRMGSESNRLEGGGNLPWRGRWLIMSNKSN